MVRKYIKYFYSQGNSPAAIDSCMEQLFDYMFAKNYSLKNIVLTNVFFKANDNIYSQIDEINEVFEKYRLDIPALKISEAAHNFDIVLEVWFIEGLYYTRNFGEGYKVVCRDDVFELYASAQYCSRKSESIFEDTSYRIIRIMKRNKFPTNTIVKQWGYIGNIVGNTENEQNYQKYNNTRSELYSKVNWSSGYPSATGIGAKGELLGVSVVAVSSKSEFSSVYPLGNPRQVDAHTYSDNVLISEEIEKTTPKFERAKVVFTKANTDIYISGTSAIIGEDSVVESDIEVQTQTTIENILALISFDNLKRYLPESELHRFENLNLAKDFSYLRIYLKDMNDYEKIKNLCLEAFGNVQMIFLEADICRSELNVEIEGAIFI